MFSGLVREIAPIQSFQGGRLTLRSSLAPQIGDSIAVNGACLTVIASTPQDFSLELSALTQESIAIENLKGQAHIEPALRASDRLDGHFVQGHIDAIGSITEIRATGEQSDFWIRVPTSIAPLLIPRGSVCIDGISLTITDVSEDLLQLTLIPHTLRTTLFGSYSIGRRVNIETDMLVRSVARILGQMRAKHPSQSELDAITLGY